MINYRSINRVDCSQFDKEYTGPGGAEEEVEKATKEEFQIAKWLRSHVPTKKTKFLNHNVEYFTCKLNLYLHSFSIYQMFHINNILICICFKFF